jgi:uncharacterized integral membrane protein
MRIFSGFFGLIILALALSFALSNRQDVTVAMWPSSVSAEMPLYLVGLGPLFFGLLLGSLWGVVSSLAHRMRARRLGRELTDMNNKLKKMSGTDGAPKKSFWR